MSVLVVAAVIVEQDRVLVTKRPPGSHLAGKWEFPGGKVRPREDPRMALARELREELAVDALARDVFEVTYHEYESGSIILLFFDAIILPSSDAPRPVQVADIAWRTASELIDSDFPPADTAILGKLRAHLLAR